jgi:SHS2 domain-containing protein
VSPTHHFEESDELRLIIEAGGLAEVLREAARALGELGDSPSGELDPEPVELTVEAPDAAGLLVGWLNEIIGRAESDGWLAREFDVLEIGPKRLRVRARGSAWSSRSFPVKAATLDRARVVRTPDGFRAEVTLDV